MPPICILKDLNNGNKLGDSPANYYPSSRTELEEQLFCAKKDHEVAIYWESQFADNYDVLDMKHKRIQDDFDKSKNENKKLSDRVHQLGEEISQLHSEKNELMLQITRKNISLADAESKFSIKSEEMQASQSKMKEEIQALQTRVEELEQDLSSVQEELLEMESLQSRAEKLKRDLSLAQKELLEIESLRPKWELRNAELFTKNIDLDLEKRDLEDTLIKKKNNLATAQWALIEKDTLLQEAILNNSYLVEQISKISRKSEVLGGVSGLEKDNGITSSETTPKLAHSVFFQHHESSRNVGHPAMSWPFAMLVTGRSGTGKTNLLANLVLGDKSEHIYKRQKGRSRYIRCDDLIVCGYHPDEPKWAFVRYMYGKIASNPKAPYYENIRFSYISPEQIPSVKSFSPERSTVIIFEDLCVAPEHIQN
ncbi:hypothetical protein GLOIN_2v1830120 [Rhizophagus clarus]|uniref:Uncharacterized protein n=1 Tax=Rhizophagus clarus TaxID=94130 RepID=A0A8H3QBS6_9GLOM|nr:hypothetical protein GLOIN_2v1830120 [Rhizophagus clarus]